MLQISDGVKKWSVLVPTAVLPTPWRVAARRRRARPPGAGQGGAHRPPDRRPSQERQHLAARHAVAPLPGAPRPARLPDRHLRRAGAPQPGDPADQRDQRLLQLRGRGRRGARAGCAGLAAPPQADRVPRPPSLRHRGVLVLPVHQAPVGAQAGADQSLHRASDRPAHDRHVGVRAPQRHRRAVPDRLPQHLGAQRRPSAAGDRGPLRGPARRAAPDAAAGSPR